MNINFKTTQYYYLNYDGYVDRNNKMKELIFKLGINCIRVGNNLNDSLRQNRISMGFINLLRIAISNNIFPFVTIDDDVELIESLPSMLLIPSETDLIFLGGSLYECGGIKPNMYLKEYNDLYYRVYYMLSLHSMIVPNLQSALFLIDIISEAIKINEFPDLMITMYSDKKVFLTPKNGPYFYQDNYNSEVTKFSWKNLPQLIRN